MKKSIVLFVLLVLVLSITGCSSSIYSNELIINSETIDRMDIGVVVREGEIVFDGDVAAGEMYVLNVDNKEQVEAVVDLLKDIKVKELSPEQVQEIESSDVQKIKYQIGLTASSEPRHESLKGAVYVLEEGKLMFIDPQTIVNPSRNAQEIERTLVYISEKKQADVINGLVEIIQDAEHEFLN